MGKQLEHHMKPKTFRLDELTIGTLKGYAKMMKTDESKVVRLALARFFAGHFVDGMASPSNTQNATATEKTDRREGFSVAGGEGREASGEALRQHLAPSSREAEGLVSGVRQPTETASVVGCGNADDEGGATR